MRRIYARLFFILLFIFIGTASATTVNIANTGLQIDPPQGWVQQTNSQTGQLRFVSQDGQAIIDLNPAEDGAGLDGKKIVEAKARQTETALKQNGLTLTQRSSSYKENNGSYLFKTYKCNLQGQDYVFAMAFIYSGRHSILTNSALPAGIADQYLASIEKSVMGIDSPANRSLSEKKAREKNTTSPKASPPMNFAFLGMTDPEPAVKPAERVPTSNGDYQLVEEWFTGYSYRLPKSWIDSSKSTDPFSTQFSPAAMTSGFVTRNDRMRAFFRKNLEEVFQHFLSNYMSKGKVTGKRELSIGGRPARILDVEYDYPELIVKGRVIIIECEEFVYQFFMKAPSSFKGKPDPRTGNGYWEKNIEPVMTEIEKSFKSMRAEVVPGLTPHDGYVLCQSNNADIKFELPAGWIGHSHKNVNGLVNLGISNGNNFGNEGIAVRFDSYDRKPGSEYENLDSLTDKWKKDAASKPDSIGSISLIKDLVLNGIKARRIEMSTANYKRWLLMLETPRKVVLFDISGRVKPIARERSFEEAGIPSIIHLMRTVSSTRKDQFGGANSQEL